MKLFFVGALVPALLVLVGLLIHRASAWSPNEHLQELLEAIVWIIWPSWILMVDVEHTPRILAALALSSAINGCWYAAVGTSVRKFLAMGPTG